MKEPNLNRKDYKEIKKYDRTEMETFITSIYSQGFEAGFKDGVAAGDNADFKIKLLQILNKTKGIGDKTKEKILNTLKEVDKVESTNM